MAYNLLTPTVWTNLTLMAIAVISILLAFGYYKRAKISLPPYGRVNWIDVSVILGGLVLFPLILFLAPSIYVSLWIAASFLAALSQFFKPLVKRTAFGLVIALLLISFQFIVRNYMVNDLIVAIGVTFVAIYCVQGGIELKELLYLGLGYSIYDILAVFFLQSFFSAHLLTGPLVPLIIAQTAGQARLLGGADLLLLELLALEFVRLDRARTAFAFGSLGVLAIFITGILVPYTTVPFSPVLTILAFLMSGVWQNWFHRPLGAESEIRMESSIVRA